MDARKRVKEKANVLLKSSTRAELEGYYRRLKWHVVWILLSMEGERSLFMAMYQIDKTKATKFYQNKKERRKREKVALSSWARLGASETTFGTL